jgi:hypothetical protein
MILTTRDLMLVSGERVRTVSKYSAADAPPNRFSYCKCGHDNHRMALKCVRCSKRIRL